MTDYMTQTVMNEKPKLGQMKRVIRSLQRISNICHKNSTHNPVVGRTSFQSHQTSRNTDEKRLGRTKYSPFQKFWRWMFFDVFVNSQCHNYNSKFCLTDRNIGSPSYN